MTEGFEVGSVHGTNLWGDVVVVEYLDNKNITVMFVNSGNTANVQKVNLRRGYVKDLALQMQQTEHKKRLEAWDKNFQRSVELHHRKIQNINTQIKAARLREGKRQDALQKYVDEIFEFYSHRHHPRYGSYHVINEFSKDLFNVLFLATGYQHTFHITSIRANKVRDYSVFSKEEERHLCREKNAQHYLSNREIRLEKAKQWQKDNPDKARVRNRNRRARRISADGVHTLEETQELLLSQNGKCACCSVVLDDEAHLDHIMPLVLGGSNWIENLQWLCQFCNNSKSAKHPDSWAAEILTPEWQDRRKQRLAEGQFLNLKF